MEETGKTILGFVAFFLFAGGLSFITYILCKEANKIIDNKEKEL